MICGGGLKSSRFFRNKKKTKLKLNLLIIKWLQHQAGWFWCLSSVFQYRGVDWDSLEHSLTTNYPYQMVINPKNPQLNNYITCKADFRVSIGFRYRGVALKSLEWPQTTNYTGQQKMSKPKKYRTSLIRGGWFRIWQSFLNLWSRFCSVAIFAVFWSKITFSKISRNFKKI